MSIPPQSAGPRARLVPRSPADRIRRVNLHAPWHQDLYHHALTLRWWEFLAVGCSIYLGVNVIFALLYLLQPGSIAGAHGGFWDAFFFSVQTIATIGYGQMSPGTFYCNLLVTLETLTGLVFLALATGVTFARISRPTARVLFARVATVGPYNGAPTLSFRLGNERTSQILEASVAVSLLRLEQTKEGTSIRRFYDLALVRSHTPVFALSFTIMHQIDERSPLYGMTPDSMAAEEAELLVTVTGLEERTSQTVHARHSYLPAEVLFETRFRDMFLSDEKGMLLDYAWFDQTEPLPAAPQGAGRQPQPDAG